jgi:hypothetical protein
MSGWLQLQVTQEGVPMGDKWLWNSIVLLFNQQFADVLSQEKARVILQKGIKMERRDIDTGTSPNLNNWYTMPDFKSVNHCT